MYEDQGTRTFLSIQEEGGVAAHGISCYLLLVIHGQAVLLDKDEAYILGLLLTVS